MHSASLGVCQVSPNRKTCFAPCRSLSSPLIPVRGRPAASRRLPKLPCVLNGGSPLQWTAKTRQPNEYRSEAVFRASSNAYSGATQFAATFSKQISRSRQGAHTHVIKGPLDVRHSASIKCRELPSSRLTIGMCQRNCQSQSANLPISL